MLVKTRGIVLKAIKYSETSLIVDVYTEAQGLQKYIVNGVRSPKSKMKAGLLQVMTLLDLVVYHRDNRDLHRLREMRPAFVYQALPFDIRRSAVGLFMAEIARKTIRESEENRPLFEFIFQAFCHLDQTSAPVSNLHLWFLLHLSAYLGFLPAGDYSEETPVFDLQEGSFIDHGGPNRHIVGPPLSERLYELLLCEPAQSHEVPLSGSQRRVLLLYLLDFYRLHLENLPEIHSHLILQEVLE